MLFNYSFQPPQVFIATSFDLKLTVENPATGSKAHFSGGPKGDEIDITFPVGSGQTDLVNSLSFTASSLTPGFTCSKAAGGNYFAIKAPAGGDLLPGNKIEIVFSAVVINGQTGSASVNIQEFVGGTSGSTLVGVTKLPQSLGLIAWLEPLVVGLQQQSTLFWQSMGATKVQVSGFNDPPATRTFIVKGSQPPYSDNCQVSVPSTESQRTYILEAFTGDGKHTPQQPVTLTQSAPLITSFTPVITGAIGVSDKISLRWSTLFAASTTLKPPGAIMFNPLSPLQVTPGQDIANAYQGNYQSMPDTASYILSAIGYQNNPIQTLSFKLAPVGLSFFKFMNKATNGTLSGVKWETDPEDWDPIEVSLSNVLNTLTIYQPGGTSDVYYLGSGDTVHPQVQYFNAQDNGSGQYIFSWVTANLKSLVLSPGNYQIDASQIQNGSMTLSLTAAQYVLTGTGNNGETIVSKLSVPFTVIQHHRHFESFGEVLVDPNCTITVTPGAGIPNYYAPSPANRNDATTAIALLTFGDIWRLPPWRIVQGSVRLDVQGAIAGHGRNWQVQVNGIQGHSTISGITVQGNLATASTPARQAYVERMVRRALVDSLTSALLQDVNGPCR
jgi:hypothetical protein